MAAGWFEQATGDAVDVASKLFRDPDKDEVDLLKLMKQWATTASSRNDAKATVLIDWLNKNIRPNKKWTDERVIIFTEYRATQNWLLEILAQRGFTGGERLMTM